MHHPTGKALAAHPYIVTSPPGISTSPATPREINHSTGTDAELERGAITRERREEVDRLAKDLRAEHRAVVVVVAPRDLLTKEVLLHAKGAYVPTQRSGDTPEQLAQAAASTH